MKKTILIDDKEYIVKEAKTTEQRAKGLSEITDMPDNEGMLFYFDSPQSVSFWMKDTLIPLDIIFIDEDEEIISIKQGIPEDTTPITEDNVKYVLEVKINSDITTDSEIDLDPNLDYVMKVLAPDGSTQMQLQGGERIFSRISTRVMIRKAKKAQRLGTDSAYKALGKYLFKELKAQDTREPEFVELKD